MATILNEAKKALKGEIEVCQEAESMLGENIIDKDVTGKNPAIYYTTISDEDMDRIRIKASKVAGQAEIVKDMANTKKTKEKYQNTVNRMSYIANIGNGSEEETQSN